MCNIFYFHLRKKETKALWQNYLKKYFIDIKLLIWAFLQIKTIQGTIISSKSGGLGSFLWVINDATQHLTVLNLSFFHIG